MADGHGRRSLGQAGESLSVAVWTTGVSFASHPPTSDSKHLPASCVNTCSFLSPTQLVCSLTLHSCEAGV